MCCGSANWKREEVPDHKFDFIDVRDFRNNGCFQQFKYVFLFIMVVKSFAVYVADIYTAVTLLAFGHFSGSLYDKVQNDPQNNFRVPIAYGRWIFSGCIIFSFLLLAYEAHKSRAIVKSRDISYAYTNVMANNYYSLRSYDHFCFFDHINDSKKKKDELAFFIFFTFKGWKRLLVADGPRQVINFFTLYGLGSFANWSTDPYDYYEGNIFTGIMILSMLFTVAVFAGSVILLMLAGIAYIPLLCYIKGNLKEYCCHKVDKRVTELVQLKKKQRLAKVAEIARKEAAGDFSHLMNKKGQMVGQAMAQPTLPTVDIDLLNDEKPVKSAALQRTNSVGSSVHGNGAGYYGQPGMPGYQSPGIGPSHFYGVNAPSSHSLGYDKPEYASTANLVSNAGPAGNDFAPGMSHSAFDAMADRMGPIGTSPMLFAQRVGGGPGRVSPAPPSSQPHMDPYSSNNAGSGRRALLDASNGGMSQEHGASGDAFDLYGRQSPHMDASGMHKDTPYGSQGLDYPPPQNTHGVDGLDYPPPPAPDISTYAPYHGQGEYDRTTPTVEVSAAPASTAHQGSNGHLAVGYGTDGFGGELHPDRYSNSNGARSGANSSSHSPSTSVGGLDDVYDAYYHSHEPSPDITAEQRHSYMMSDYPTHAGTDAYQQHQHQQYHVDANSGGGYEQYHGSQHGYADQWSHPNQAEMQHAEQYRQTDPYRQQSSRQGY
ncbi:Low affinity K(+) transporter 1 [Pseudozyma hubeiensis]|nr:Low affinity K(+) transporter 1 [Pseudozyma hubeiensis]